MKKKKDGLSCPVLLSLLCVTVSSGGTVQWLYRVRFRFGRSRPHTFLDNGFVSFRSFVGFSLCFVPFGFTFVALLISCVLVLILVLFVGVRFARDS